MGYTIEIELANMHAINCCCELAVLAVSYIFTKFGYFNVC